MIEERESRLNLERAVRLLHEESMIKKHVSSDGSFVNDTLKIACVQSANKSKFNAAMELAFYVSSPEEIKDLSDKNVSEERLNNLTKSIQARALKKMRNLEIDYEIAKLSKDNDKDKIAELEKKKNNKGREKAFVLGLGARVVTYKNKNGQSKGGFVPLVKCIHNLHSKTGGAEEDKVGLMAKTKAFFAPRKR